MRLFKHSRVALVLAVTLCSAILASPLNVAEAATNKKPYMNIETPTTSLVTTPNCRISGWAITDSGNKQINVLVDGKIVGQAIKGVTKRYIADIYPSYKDSLQSGYYYDLNTEKLSYGIHKVTINVTGNNNLKVSKDISLFINNLPPITNVEAPLNKSVIKGDLTVSGWALNASGVKNVNILLDNKLVGQASAAIKRTDISRQYPKYNIQNCGYTFTVPAKLITPGIHTLLVQAVGINGVQMGKSISFTYASTPTVKKKSFAIDCGHGLLVDTGATGLKQEDDLTLEVGTLVINKLRSAGYTVYAARPKTAIDLKDSLKKRCDVANNNKVDFFASIHFNKFDGTAHGTEVYTDSDIGAKVGNEILKNMTALGYCNRGVESADFYVLKHTQMPSILIETAFLDNAGDMKLYNADKISDAIVKALIDYANY